MRLHLPMMCFLVCAAGCDGRGWTSTTPVTAEPPELRLLALYDTNDDQELNEAELVPHLAHPAEFREIDLDGDGRVVGSELRAALCLQMAARRLTTR